MNDVDRLRADYDATPYDSDAFPQPAPGRLAAIAHLFGLDSPDVTSARVLEIGCAAGGNLIPFAAGHPGEQAVGIDLSGVQIAQGRHTVERLGLTNLELVAGDICPPDAQRDLAALGRFDVIIAHGVYSWVPPNVQDALLSAVRDAMLLASGASAAPGEEAHEARGMAYFLEEVAPADGVLARVLAEFRSREHGLGDSYLLNDELETFNAPCYFYEMLGRARGHGLEFLAEARPETMFPANHGPKVEAYLRGKCGGIQILVEQYLDFAVDRAFRESLFVHADRASQICYPPDRSRYAALHFAAWTPPVAGPTVSDHSRQEYEVADGATLFTNDPGLTPSAELAGHVDDLTGVLIVQGQVRYRLGPVLPPPVPAEAQRVDETLLPTPVDRILLPLLDGTRDGAALLAADREHPLGLDREALIREVDGLPGRLAELKLARVDR